MSVAALWTKHRGLALGLARELRLPGAEMQDLEQEALIGLWVAARTWDEGKGPFRPFAALVVRRRLVAVLRAALRGKHQPLNDSVRRTVREDDGAEIAIVDTLPGGHDPYEVVVLRETFARMVGAVASLTEIERTALAVIVLDGACAHPTLDNAAYRARNKLRVAVGETAT